MDAEQIESQRIFGGAQLKFRHPSKALDCSMNFSLYLPPQAMEGERVPSHWEKPVEGETLYCLDCKTVPIIGPLSAFEPVKGGFLCAGCAGERTMALFEEEKRIRDERMRLVNPELYDD